MRSDPDWVAGIFENKAQLSIVEHEFGFTNRVLIFFYKYYNEI